MLRESADQVKKPDPKRRWPQVANRHRKKAMDEAQAIVELIQADFMGMLNGEIDEDLTDAITSVRHNPAKALRHLRDVQLRFQTLVRSAQIIQEKASAIYMILDSAPADDNEEGNHNE